MNEIIPRASLSRRSFLKRFAVSSAVLATSPHLPSIIMLQHDLPNAMRIGVLLPSFRNYPQVGASFLDGMAFFLGQEGTEDKLQTVRLFAARTAAQAGISQEALAAVCEEAALDVVVSLANPEASMELRDVLQQTGVPLLISHAGANFVDRKEPNVFYNTLGYWQASYRAGAWAAESMGRRALVVSSFYESGYDAAHAFEAGFADHGGHVSGRYVTHVPGRPISMHDLMGNIAASAPEFVYAHLSGADGADFMTAYCSSRYTRDTPLLASTFLIEDAVPGAAAGITRTLRSVGSWSPLLETPLNLAFRASFERRYGRAADSFSVLGYDTAGLLAGASQLAAAKGLSLAAGLSEAQFEGPRGLLAMDAATQSNTPRLYLRQLDWQDGAYRARILSELPPVAADALRREGPRSGWLHPYLSI